MATTADKSLDLNEIIWAQPRDKHNVLYGLFEEALADRSHQDLDNIVGSLIKIGWADGYAAYIIVKARPMTLMHVYLGDGWQVPFYMIRGLRKIDLEGMRDRPDDGRGSWPYFKDGEVTDADREFVKETLHRLLPKIFKS